MKTIIYTKAVPFYTKNFFSQKYRKLSKAIIFAIHYTLRGEKKLEDNPIIFISVWENQNQTSSV